MSSAGMIKYEVLSQYIFKYNIYIYFKLSFYTWIHNNFDLVFVKNDILGIYIYHSLVKLGW